MGGIGWKEILIIAAIIMLLFGARKLPELARSLRKSVDEFKKGSEEDDDTAEAKSSGGTKKTPKVDVDTASKN